MLSGLGMCRSSWCVSFLLQMQPCDCLHLHQLWPRSFLLLLVDLPSQFTIGIAA